MVGKKNDKKPRGFVIVADDCQASNWARMYLSKIRGEKKEETCGPHNLEILRAVEECSKSCWRVVLITRAYTVGSDREVLIQNLKGYYPKLEIVYMPCS